MNVSCPECSTVYRVDPERIPEGGVATRCRSCATLFRVEPTRQGAGEVTAATPVSPAGETPRPEDPGQEGHHVGQHPVEEHHVEEHHVEQPAGEVHGVGQPTAEPLPGSVEEEESGEPEGAGAGAQAGGGAPVFGPQDPETRARRLARALVSDITVYNPERWEESRKAGTLRKDFRDEILKSWEEYVEQVGESMAKKTPYFRDALNDILARGDRIF